MKIIIDSRPFSRPSSGIRRYLEGVIRGFDASHQWIYLCDRPLADTDRQTTLPENIRKPLRAMLWPLWVVWQVWRERPDLYWSPRHHLPLWLPRRTIAVVTIHDLTWRNYPESMPWYRRWVERHLMPRAIQRADAIIVPTQVIADELRSVFNHLKIVVIHHGGDFFGGEPRKTPYLQQVPQFYLSVATYEPRKGLEDLANGWLRYRQAGGTRALIIVGSDGWGGVKARLMAALDGQSGYYLLPNLADDEIAWLYRHCDALVSLSYYEGFGLPLIESAPFVPVQILAPIGVYREIATGSVQWLDDRQPETIANALLGLDRGEGVPTRDPHREYRRWFDSGRDHQQLFEQLNAH
ncbi:glycosyltransferase family 1 protein [Gammaproteobacteria bacterium]|nr:glycosyltransferase family 1 protein [Gammaproteobacteria bacterium]